MPNHLPTIDDVIAGNIKFFSLDTSVLHQVGYRFSEGKLLDLDLQLPSQVKLIFPEIVYQEVLSHQEDDVMCELRKLENIIRNLKRKKVLDNDLGISIEQLKEKYLENLKEEIESYLVKFDGEILKIKDCNISDVFHSYFNKKAPFENNANKKNEFPDAVCLDLLENYAKENSQVGIIISNDNGWKNFSETSNYLYYANSIDEFTKLFEAGNYKLAEAESIRVKIIEALKNNKSEIYSQIVECLDNVYWDASNVYSENLYSCDADVTSYDFQKFSVLDVNIWKSEKNGEIWILNADLSFNMELEVDVESYAKDWVDKELISMGFSKLSVDVNPEFQFHIICSNINIDSDYSNWNMDIKLINNHYTLDEIGVSHSFE